MAVDLEARWSIGSVEIPGRLALAPMAGVSVQAFRRQGRRYGAGLVCSEMVSCAGLSHGNERTLGYLRIGRDEHPLAVQIFGSEPETMAEAARMVEDAGADLVDINFGCPVRKVTKTGAGATLLEDPDRACRIVESVAGAVDVPVSVKMRRGLENGSRAALSVGPRLVEAGAASLTLHPRSAKQMYTGTADHELTAELVDLVDVPVLASGDVDTRARAEAVLESTKCAAVMVGRAAQGNPWALGEIAGQLDSEPTREEIVAELLLFMHAYAVGSLDSIRAVPSSDAFEIRPVRLHFGVESFGINAYTASSAGGRVIEEHDELGAGAGHQEELYIVARGHAVFEIAGEKIEAPAGTLVFVGDPAVRRGAVAKEDGTTVLVVGAVVGQAFQPSPWESWLAAYPFLEAGEPERGIEIFLRALERHPGNPNVLYNLACFESLAGEREHALAHLAEAVEAEPQMREWAQEDSDFDAIRADPRFPAGD